MVMPVWFKLAANGLGKDSNHFLLHRECDRSGRAELFVLPRGQLRVDAMGPGGEAFEQIAVSLDDGLETSIDVEMHAVASISLVHF